MQRFFTSLILVVSIAGCNSGADDHGTLASPLAARNTQEFAGCTIPKITLDHGTSSVGDARMHILSKTKYPKAVCNDGTPATYVFRPGVGKGVKRWIVYLEGGGQCATGAACAARFIKTPGYMTSNGAVDGKVIDPASLGGIRSSSSSENPDFYDFNYVQIQYCSSDAWSGNKAAVADAPRDEIEHWNFRGRSIVDAVLTELESQGLEQAEQLLLAGSSAGGIGVAVHADDLLSRYPKTRFLALDDAGFFIDYPAFDPVTRKESTASPSARYTELAAGVAAWGGRGDASCETAQANGGDPVICRGPAALYGGNYLKTRVFIRQSLRDSVQTKGFIEPGENDASAVAYRKRFWMALGSQLSSLTGPYAVFAPNDANHGVINDTIAWTAAEIGGVRLKTDIRNWYQDPCTNTRKRIDAP